MTWKKGESGNVYGREKQFTDQLRLVAHEEVDAADKDGKVRKIRKLRRMAEVVFEEALKGEAWAVQQVADRLDGKPAQESTVNINDNRDISEWSAGELDRELAVVRASLGTKEAPAGRNGKPDRVH